MICTVTLPFHQKNLHGVFYHDNRAETLLVMFHGFTGTKTEAHYNFKRWSELFLNEGIATLRFDYLGCGESEGHFEDLTKESLIKQMQVIWQYAMTRPYKRWVGLGFSMSGQLMLETLLPTMDAVILVNPAFNMDSILKDLYQTNAALSDTTVDLDGLILSKKMVDSFQTPWSRSALHDYRNAILLLHGTNDETVPIHFSKTFAENVEQCIFKKVITDHTVSGYLAFNTIAREIITFLNRRV